MGDGMKRLLVAAAGLMAIGAVQSANAADLAPPFPAKAPVPLWNWTGIYVGGNFGFATDNFSFSGTTPAHGAVPTTTFSGSKFTNGVVGGGQVGGNWQLPAWPVVVGVEADIDATSLKSVLNTCAITAAGTVQSCTSHNSLLNDFGTVRGRLGYAWDNVLLFGTGGWAYARTSTNDTLVCTGAATCATTGVGLPFTGGTASTTATPSGWSAGGGLELGVWSNWVIRAEYLLLRFNGIGTTTTFTGTTGVPPAAFTATSHSTSNSTINAFELGVSYLFKL